MDALYLVWWDTLRTAKTEKGFSYKLILVQHVQFPLSLPFSRNTSNNEFD